MFAEQYLYLWIAFGLTAVTIVAAVVWNNPAEHKINSRVAEFEERYGQNKRRRATQTPKAGAMPTLFARIASFMPSAQSDSETLQARLAKGASTIPRQRRRFWAFSRCSSRRRSWRASLALSFSIGR